MSGRGQNNKRGRGGALSLKASLGMLKSSLHGHANDLKSPSPPAFTRIPFNSIVVEEVLAPVTTSGGVAAANTGDVSCFDIIDALKAQINIPDAADVTIMIKVKRIDLWSSTNSGSSNPPSIRGKYFGLTQFRYYQQPHDIIVNPIKSLEDIGLQGSESAVVSYTFPRDQADIPLSKLGAIPIVSWTRSAEDQTVIARYHLLWNTADNSQIVSVSEAPTMAVAPPNTPTS